jgi:hypothetical protein
VIVLASQLGAREESWPIENVSKISLLTGELWGHSLPMLWAKALYYFAATLLLDIFSRFVQETVKVFPIPIPGWFGWALSKYYSLPRPQEADVTLNFLSLYRFDFRSFLVE